MTESKEYHTPEGIILEPVEVTNQEDECNGCFFYDRDCIIPCTPSERMDRKNVIFVEKK